VLIKLGNVLHPLVFNYKKKPQILVFIANGLRVCCSF